jgi:hypothetical protein
MQLAMVRTTEWDSEFIAHLTAERACLSKAQVVRV